MSEIVIVAVCFQLKQLKKQPEKNAGLNGTHRYRGKILLRYNLGDNWYSQRLPNLRCVFIFLLNLEGERSPPNLLRHVLNPK